MKSIKLNSGLEIPQLGLGVWQADNGEETINAIHWALDAGYRHIDTASIYKNEAAVGQALKTASVPRKDVWLTTKIWNDDVRAGRTTAALDEALTRLQTDYVDLLLIHWPVNGYLAAWKALEQALAAGKVRAIGVSNFMETHLEDIVEHGEILPAVNQIEYHPYLVQADAISFCDMHDIAITAWSPLMQGHFKEEPLFAEIAKAYGKTPAQLVLRWCLQNDVIVIPKSTNKGRIAQNADLFDFELSEAHMIAIDELERNHRFGPDPLNFDF
jgi:diketogulonate reductase-like aldo/keto reductase